MRVFLEMGMVGEFEFWIDFGVVWFEFFMMVLILFKV